jgi:hypothetical protein
MPKTVWGRKETIVWPCHMPIYTYAVAFAVAFITFVAICIRIHLATPLERSCLAVAMRRHGIQRVLVLSGGLAAWKTLGFPLSSVSADPDAELARLGIQVMPGLSYAKVRSKV